MSLPDWYIPVHANIEQKALTLDCGQRGRVARFKNKFERRAIPVCPMALFLPPLDISSSPIPNPE
jgi:hypothetical protein